MRMTAQNYKMTGLAHVRRIMVMCSAVQCAKRVRKTYILRI